MKVKMIIPSHPMLVLSLVSQDYVKLCGIKLFCIFLHPQSSRLVYFLKNKTTAVIGDIWIKILLNLKNYLGNIEFTINLQVRTTYTIKAFRSVCIFCILTDIRFNLNPYIYISKYLMIGIFTVISFQLWFSSII